LQNFKPAATSVDALFCQKNALSRADLHTSAPLKSWVIKVPEAATLSHRKKIIAVLSCRDIYYLFIEPLMVEIDAPVRPSTFSTAGAVAFCSE
jgi:hypothetical protein